MLACELQTLNLANVSPLFVDNTEGMTWILYEFSEPVQQLFQILQPENLKKDLVEIYFQLNPTYVVAKLSMYIVNG